MKNALTFIAVVLFTFSISARELTPKEQLALLPLKKTKTVKEYMESNIDESKLSFKDYFAYQLLKKSCAPLDFLLDGIKGQEDGYPDQTEKIIGTYQVCSEGTLGITNLYIKQQ